MRAKELKSKFDYVDPVEADYGDDYQRMVKRVGQKAKEGPRKTVYDPVKRVYKTVPINKVHTTEGEITEEMIADKLRKDLEVFKRGQKKDRELSKKPRDKDIIAKEDNPCWKNYKQIGMKKGKNGKMVPDCRGPVEEGWVKNAVAGAALAGAALTGGNAQAADLSHYNTQYLQSVVSGENSRPMVSIDDAKVELQARANGKQQAQPTPTKATSGYSKEYLQSVVDGTHPRPMISAERAQQLLGQMNEAKKK